MLDKVGNGHAQKLTLKIKSATAKQFPYVSIYNKN